MKLKILTAVSLFFALSPLQAEERVCIVDIDDDRLVIPKECVENDVLSLIDAIGAFRRPAKIKSIFGELAATCKLGTIDYEMNQSSFMSFICRYRGKDNILKIRGEDN